MMFIARGSHQVERARSTDPAWLVRGLVAGIILSVIAQAWLIFFQMFGPDEFHFLGQAHSYLRGSLDLTLQTLHVHLFAPLASLPGSEIEQLIAGRLAMLAFEGVSLLSLYTLSRTWAGKVPSLLAVLAFATMPLTLQHGASFRTDPLALALIMASLALLARAQMRAPAIVSVGLLGAIAFLVTIKAVLFVPAFAGVAAWRIARSSDRIHMAKAIAAIVAVAAAGTVSIYLLHQSTLQVASVAKSGEMVASAGLTTIVDAGFLPQPDVLIFAAATAPLQVLLLLASIVTLAMRLGAGRPGDRWQNVAILGCLLPLASLLFYRNAFPYFIPTITAPAFVAVAWFIERRRWSSALAAILAGGVIATGALFLARFSLVDQSEQRASIEAVHRIFPEPVAYIDASSMIASFPGRGFFMSGWGMAEYRKRPPIFEDMLREQQIPLLVLNGSALEQALGLGESRNGRLLPADRRVLRENYIPHWGPLWVAGKHVHIGAGQTQITILIPGPYTVEGAPVTLDGQDHRPGDTLVLSRSTYRLSGAPGNEVILRWGNHLARPAAPAPVNLSRGF